MRIERARLEKEEKRRIAAIARIVKKTFFSSNVSFNNLAELVDLGKVKDVSQLRALLETMWRESIGYERFSKYYLLWTGLPEPITHYQALLRFSVPSQNYATAAETLGMILSNRSDLWLVLEGGYRLIALGRDVFNVYWCHYVGFYLEEGVLCMKREYAHRTTPWYSDDLAVLRKF